LDASQTKAVTPVARQWLN